MSLACTCGTAASVEGCCVLLALVALVTAR